MSKGLHHIQGSTLPDRLQLSTWEKFEHYAFVVIILLPVFFTLYTFLKNKKSVDEIPFFEALLILLAIYFLYSKHRGLKFKKYKQPHTYQHFQEAAKATANELNWRIGQLNAAGLVAIKEDIGWQWEGIRVTVLRDDSKIYFNSIVNPSVRSNPFGFGWNDKNLRVFSSNLIDATEGIDVVKRADEKIAEEERKVEKEPEWNTRNTLKRMIRYIVIGILLFICILMLKEEVSPVPIAVLALCIGYIIVDVRIILSKRKKQMQSFD